MTTTELPEGRNGDERPTPREQETRDEATGTCIGEDLSQWGACAKIEDNCTYTNKDKNCCSEQFCSVFRPMELFAPNLIVHWSFPSNCSTYKGVAVNCKTICCELCGAIFTRSVV